MSLNIGVSKSPPSASGGNPSSNGEGIESTGHVNDDPSIDQLSHGMTDMSTDAGQEGEWEVVARNCMSRDGGNAAKQWDSSSCAPTTWEPSDIAPTPGLTANCGAGKPYGNNWVQAVNSRGPADGENCKTHSPGNVWPSWESAHVAVPPAVPPSLQHRWQWAARSSSFVPQTKVSEDKEWNGTASREVLKRGSSGGYDSGLDMVPVQSDDGSDSSELVADSDFGLSDDYDSDVSEKSFETRKQNKWFRVFFETMATLSVDQLNEPTRLWHCPACQSGPGAIDWFRGLQPLLTHAKTKGTKRIELHREFAELLEEELQMRGASVILIGEVFGRWKGLREASSDHSIVWPPMVVIVNTELEQDDNDKWIGMGAQELLEYFPSYAAVKARHSYGPNGHRGISVLVFEASGIGYMEADRLHKHFADEGRGRKAWECHRVLFCPGGKRRLYGFLALKEDIDDFNKHSKGIAQLKFEMKSYQDMVVGTMRQMSEDNQQLVWLKNKVAKLQQYSKALEESFEVVSQKIREGMEENRIVRFRNKMQHEENKEEMDQQELFFKEQMNKIHKVVEERKRIFETLLHEVGAEAWQPDADKGAREEKLRGEEIARIMDIKVKEAEKFLVERD